MTDLISRQAAIEAIKRCELPDYEFNNGLISAMNALDEVPSIDPAMYYNKLEAIRNSIYIYNCPRCGTRMFITKEE